MSFVRMICFINQANSVEGQANFILFLCLWFHVGYRLRFPLPVVLGKMPGCGNSFDFGVFPNESWLAYFSCLSDSRNFFTAVAI